MSRSANGLEVSDYVPTAARPDRTFRDCRALLFLGTQGDQCDFRFPELGQYDTQKSNI